MPAAWKVVSMVSLYKGKGLDRRQPSNYRGIAIGPCLAKLYARVIMTRIDRQAEASGWRALG